MLHPICTHKTDGVDQNPEALSRPYRASLVCQAKSQSLRDAGFARGLALRKSELSPLLAPEAIIEPSRPRHQPHPLGPLASETMQRLQSGGDAPCRFPTTQWSRVVTAGSRGTTEAREALSSLCQAYWYPIYAYVRHRGQSPEQAQDATQEFFAYMLEHDVIAMADPARGRFRTFLLTVCSRHLAAERNRRNAGKRGGARSLLPLEPFDAERRYQSEPADLLTPERIFDRTWALTLLARVVERLRGEYDNADRSDRFQELLAILTRDRASESYAEIALRLGITEGNVRVAVHRLRRRYAIVLREEISATVGDDAEIDDEIRSLFAALKLEARK
jgi:RNA polymerase sigma factor (sigma-70 family)